MANFKVIVLVCVVIVGVCGLESTVKFDPEPNHSTIPPEPPTTNKPTTSTTVTTPKTTITTSTSAPNTTTTSTTVKPTTSTSKPTPSPTPNPAPVDPKVANWTVNYDNSNRSCIILSVAAQFEIIGANKTKSIKVNVPVDAAGGGSCEGNNTQTLTLAWSGTNTFNLTFEKTNSNKFDIKTISASLDIKTETENTFYGLYLKKAEFSTPLGNSYKCGHQQTLNLTEENGNVTFAYLHLNHLQYQAFRNSTEHKFDSALDCDSSVTPDVVPIVVGCVLAALVVAVLAAYLFGRRRCQARGYLSMFEETRTEADYIPMKNLSCFN